jgi:hypothetical protein
VVFAVAALRPLFTLAAVLALATGCTSTIAGAGSPETGAPSSRVTSARTAAPTPTATYNGVASLTGEEAMGAAYYALQHAPSVRLKATFGAGADAWTFELRYRGTDSDGTYVVDGMTVQIRTVGRSVYRKASQEYWRSWLGPAADQLPPGKWIKVPITEKSLKDFADLLRQGQMAKTFLGLPGTLSTGVFKTVNGIETVPVISDGPDKETAYVAIVGEPYPVRIETGTGVGSADFLDYGRPVTITAPPPAQVAEFEVLPTS